MLNRSFKVFILVVAVLAGCFFLFNYYLPSKIDAAGSANRVHVKVNDILPRQGPEKESIAVSLGIPKPNTHTYTKFEPKNIAKQKKNIRQIFLVPKEIKPEVDFWKNVYSKYDKTRIIFHDKKHMDVVYSVLDISKIVNSTRLTDAEKTSKKQETAYDEQDRLEKILKGLDDKELRDMTAEEKIVYHLFDNVKEENKFAKAADSDRLRWQTGIKEKFIEGVKVSGRYLGEMEKIFASYGVPLEITRLAFVESTFNLAAVSKVGASGVWQFMPSSGRLFLTINQIVDERNDPIMATHAAAKHLVRDYNMLESWPLAINSYNSGRGRIERAVRTLGTKDIAQIIRNHEYGGYGFASRNFYPAFLAALDVFENREQYFGKIEMDGPLEFDIIETPFFATIPELSQYTGIEELKLITLNHHLQSSIINGSIPIPVGFKLKTPKGKGEDTLIAMKEMDDLTKFAKWHIVKPGEKLTTIATKYKTNASDLRRINNLHKNSIKTGQILKLPKGIDLAQE